MNDGGTAGDDASLVHHLLQIGNQGNLHLVVGQTGGERDPNTGDKTPTLISLKPKVQGFQGQIRSFGYVGAFLAELAALWELNDRASKGEAASLVLKAVLAPSSEVAGHWHPAPPPTEDFVRGDQTKAPKANESQKAAVCALKYALEKIQGPPGTGKSTTIYHVITQRVPRGERVLVTCSRNVAIESIAQKLEACDADMLVVGAPGRIGSTARKHLLESKVDSHPSVRAEAAKSLMGRDSPSATEMAKTVRGPLMEKCQIILCTIASTSRLLREWEENVKKPLQVHTVVVDECGCTPESSTALLLNLKPKNMVLLGDHMQLPPCSLVPPHALKHTNHDRSMLERCVLGSGGKVHRLTEQYRMHPHICSVVSKISYQSMLQTADSTADVRVKTAEEHDEVDAMVWVQIFGEETTPDDGKSYVNFAEVAAVVAACHRLRQKHGHGVTIAALTFYKGQFLALLEALPASLKVECLTVDACQGAEFDYVLISPVRSNGRKAIGFVADSRRINVAVSRAKRMCIILGDRRTMSSRPGTDWHTIYSSCRKEAYHEKGCRWHAPAPEPGFLSMLQQKRMAAKEAVVSNEEEQTKTDGTNVGAAAFLPAAVLAQVAPQQKKQIPNPPGTGKKAQKKAKALAKQARQQEAMARSMNSIGMTAMGVSSGHFNPALNGGFSALPHPPPPPGHPGAMIPRRVMATGAPPLPNGTPPLPNGTPPLPTGTPQCVTMHPNGIAAPVPPPMPPPMPQRSINAAAAIMAADAQKAQAVGGARQDSDDNDSDWEPPIARLGSALNLQDLDVLKRNDSFKGLSALQNAPTMSRFGDNGGDRYPPHAPPFAFGSGDAPPVPPGPPPHRD